MDKLRTLSVVGLGYVGLPVAVSFGAIAPVIGFDVSERRVQELSNGIDRTHEVSGEQLAASDIRFTTDPSTLKQADFHIVAVPTPIDAAKQPDLSYLVSASESLGATLKKGDIVVYESTVYPGATEEICVPVLERSSGLRCGKDFKVGYSPERINPGDQVHTFSNIVKVVAGQDEESLQIIATVYEQVVTAGVHRAPSIRVAEAAKVIENTQRDLNIALMNELSVIFSKMNIDTQDVLEAAGTKWNFLRFSPGLVGGHCIGVDPYYLTHKANLLGYDPHVILAGRRINDGMGAFVVDQVVKQLIHAGLNVKECIVTVLGLTFKENVSDLRNTRVIDMLDALAAFGVRVQVHDPIASHEEAFETYGIRLKERTELVPSDCVIVAVPHDVYAKDGWLGVSNLLAGGPSVVADLKGVLPRDEVPKDVILWRL